MKKLVYFFSICAALAMASGCRNEISKQYQVEYLVTSPAAAKAQIEYTNETGGETSLDNQALPKSYKFKRAMKQADIISIVAILNDGKPASEITVAILLDGKEVEKKTSRGVNASVGVIYQIP